VGIVRAANEIGLNTKMFGGAMIGLLATPIKVQLGPLVNGLVIMESFIPAPTLDFPGLKAMLEKYQAKAPSLGIDPLGYGFTPFAYAAGQVLAQAVEATKKPRPQQARGLHPFPQVLDRGRRNRIREGRRMDEVTAVLHPVSRRGRKRSRAVPRYHAPGDPVAVGI
jgi:Periplasmic binding protein